MNRFLRACRREPVDRPPVWIMRQAGRYLRGRNRRIRCRFRPPPGAYRAWENLHPDSSIGPRGRWSCVNRFLRACRREPVDRPPVWVMRQAGRYLPEYREVRRRAGDFLTMCRTPEIATEVTLQPIRRFGFDAAIVFSDILTPLVPMGAELDLQPGPAHRATRSGTPTTSTGSTVPEPWSGTEFLSETLRAGARGAGPRDRPDRLLRRPVDARPPTWSRAATSRSLHPRQVASPSTTPRPSTGWSTGSPTPWPPTCAARSSSGAQAVQVFDSWVGALGIDDARRWALRPARRLLEQIADLGVPRIYFANGGSHLLHDLPDMPCEVIGLDWRADLARAAASCRGHALQGNLDPGVLMGPADEIRRRTLEMLEQAPRRRLHREPRPRHHAGHPGRRGRDLRANRPGLPV